MPWASAPALPGLLKGYRPARCSRELCCFVCPCFMSHIAQIVQTFSREKWFGGVTCAVNLSLPPDTSCLQKMNKVYTCCSSSLVLFIFKYRIAFVVLLVVLWDIYLCLIGIYSGLPGTVRTRWKELYLTIRGNQWVISKPLSIYNKQEMASVVQEMRKPHCAK